LAPATAAFHTPAACGPSAHIPRTQELQERLHHGGPEWHAEISRELEAALGEVPWRRVCQQVLPLMGEAELLGALRTLGGRLCGRGSGRQLRDWARGGGGGGGGAGDDGGAEDAPLVMAGVAWGDVRDALLANALACHGGALQRLLAQDDAAAAQVARLARLAARLHGDGAARGQQVGARSGQRGRGGLSNCGSGHISGRWQGQRPSAVVLTFTLHTSAPSQAFLRRLDLASPRQRLLLLLDAWTLRLHLQQRCAEEGARAVAERLLTEAGWRWERRDGRGTGGGGGGLKSVKARRQPKSSSRARERPESTPQPDGERQQQQEEGGKEGPEEQQQHPEPLSRGSAARRGRKRRRSTSSSRSSSRGGRSRSGGGGSSRRSRSSSRSRRRSSSKRKKKRKGKSKKERGREKKPRRRRRGRSRSCSLMSSGSEGAMPLSDSDAAGGSTDSGASGGGGGLAEQGGAGAGMGADSGVYKAWPPGGGPPFEGAAEGVIDAVVRWARRQWVRALV
jgi:hypothetical protein